MKLTAVLPVMIGIFVLACSTASTPLSSSPLSVSEEEFAPNFSFNLYQGEDILGSEIKDLSQLRGMPVVLNFWARLCPPCWTEMPELQEFHEESQERIILLGIDIGQFTGLGSPRDASKLLDSMGITYPTGFTDDGGVVEKFKVSAMPTTVFIDKQGRIFQKWTGALDRATVTRLAKAMLAQDSD